MRSSTTGNRLFQRFLKRDAFGGYPEWWQWFVPRYGNWGGPGWSGGRWNVGADRADRIMEPADALDEALMRHDGDYQAGELWVLADTNLVAALHNLAPPAGLYGRLYRLVAIEVFSLHVWWMLRAGRWNHL